MKAGGYLQSIIPSGTKVRKDGGHSDGRGLAHPHVTELMCRDAATECSKRLTPGRRQSQLVDTRKREQYSPSRMSQYEIIGSLQSQAILEMPSRAGPQRRMRHWGQYSQRALRAEPGPQKYANTLAGAADVTRDLESRCYPPPGHSSCFHGKGD